jgi:hypothetical protein
MTKEVTPTAKAKKFQVFVGKELKSQSNVYEQILPTLRQLQNDNVPEIHVVNHHFKVTHLYTKGRYERNYRVLETTYEAPSKAVSEEAAAE